MGNLTDMNVLVYLSVCKLFRLQNLNWRLKSAFLIKICPFSIVVFIISMVIFFVVVAHSGLEHSPCKWKFVCLNSQPRQTYLVKTGSDSSTAKCSAIGVSVKGPWRWPLWIDAPCHRCGTLKNPLLNGHECREHVKICSPSPAIVTSPYEWKILECDEKHQTSKIFVILL